MKHRGGFKTALQIIEEAIRKGDPFWTQLAKEVTVQCQACMDTKTVNYALCLREGFPICHGIPMEMAPPDIRK